MCENSKNKILIHYCESNYYVWDAESVVKLRQQHRIVGGFIGALVRKPKQSNICALPLLLLPEEVYVCVSNNIARIYTYDVQSLKTEIENRNVDEINKKRKHEENKQIAIFIAEKNRKQSDLYGVCKRKKKKKYDNSNSTEGLFHTEIESDKIESEKNKIESEKIESESDKIETCEMTADDNSQSNSNKELDSGFIDHSNLETDSNSLENNRESLPVNIPYINSTPGSKTESPGETSISKDGKSGSSSLEASIETPYLSEKQQQYYEQSIRVHIPTCISTHILQDCMDTNSLENIIRHPHSQSQLNRNTVFEHLWKQGYYLTSAEKFGGDFLVYPGDPLRFHSYFIVIVSDDTKEIASKEIITYGRLSASVRKTVVFAKVNNDDRNVKYISLNWAQMMP